MIDLEVLLALMAWFAQGEPADSVPDPLLVDRSDYSFSTRYPHTNAARTEIFFANAGESTVWLKIRFLGKYGRELAINEIEINPLEFPYIYSGLDLVDRGKQQISVHVGVEIEGLEDGKRTDVEVYLRQMNDTDSPDPSFEPFSICRRLQGPSDRATWSDC